MTKIMKPNEVAHQLQIPIKKVYQLIEQQRLKAFRVGRKLRVMEVDFQDFIKIQLERGTR